jgi:hypothetical protein
MSASNNKNHHSLFRLVKVTISGAVRAFWVGHDFNELTEPPYRRLPSSIDGWLHYGQWRFERSTNGGVEWFQCSHDPRYPRA